MLRRWAASHAARAARLPRIYSGLRAVAVAPPLAAAARPRRHSSAPADHVAAALESAGADTSWLQQHAPDSTNYLAMTLNAKVYDVCKLTDLSHAPVLSAATGNRCFLKREDQQPVFSFKLRGAYNHIVHLSAEEKARGIVTCSAGNHAQGVAFSANALDISAKIFMPRTTPQIKVDAVRSYSNAKSEVLLEGDNYDEAYAATVKCMEAEGRVLVHPFNDPHVIAGQGTIGQEILAQTTSEKIDVVFCCVGGGGLAAGVGMFLKSVKPSIKVIGVEAVDAAGMQTSLAAGKVVELQSVGLFADGAAVRKVGDETFRLCQKAVDEVITVSTDEICGAIKAGFIDTRVLLEPAGALAIAGMVKYSREHGLRGKGMVAVSSGANMDFDRLRFVSERADISETLLAVSIPERAGAFLELYRIVHPRNVTEFSYRINNDPACIFMSFQASDFEDRQQVIASLDKAGYQPKDFTDNDLAKTHAKHMVGGRAPFKMTEEEVLFRFEFPERPGALRRFLEELPTDFNVSCFHYRSHGADVGRVLVALQVPMAKRAALREYLELLTTKGYSWQEETENEVYGHWLLEPVEANTSGRSRPRKPPPLTFQS